MIITLNNMKAMIKETKILNFIITIDYKKLKLDSIEMDESMDRIVKSDIEIVINKYKENNTNVFIDGESTILINLQGIRYYDNQIDEIKILYKDRGDLKLR